MYKSYLVLKNVKHFLVLQFVFLCICSTTSFANETLDDIVVVQYTGESSHVIIHESNEKIAIEEFMLIFPQDVLEIAKGEQVVLLNTISGAQETWNGPVTMNVTGQDTTTSTTDTDQIARRPLSTKIKNETNNILYTRMGGLILRGWETKKNKHKILPKDIQEQLKKVLELK